MASEYEGILVRIEARRRSARAIQLVMFMCATLVAALSVLPPLWVILTALEPSAEFNGAPPLIPNHLHWSNLAVVWDSLHFGQLYLNSAYYLVGALVTALLFNGLFAYVLSKLRVHGARYVFTLVLWTLLLPNTLAIASVYTNVLHFPVLRLNLTNSYIPLWMIQGGNAFYVLIFKAFFDNIDDAYIEAARIDGASNLAIFRRIVLPMSKPVFITIGILTTTYVWSDFFWPYMIETTSRTEPAMVGIYNSIGVVPYEHSILSLLFGMAPPIVLFIIFQRYILRGFQLGGVTG